MWGNCLAILLPWLMVAGGLWHPQAALVHRRPSSPWRSYPSYPRLTAACGSVSGSPSCYLAVRFAARGKLAMLGVVGGVIVLAAVVILVTPVQSLISQRLSHGTSNNGRTSGSLLAVDLGLASPIVGWGDTRHEAGSAESIAIGSDGQLQDLRPEEPGR